MVLLYSPVCDLPRKERSEKNSQQENGGCEWLLPLLTAYQVKLQYSCMNIHTITVKTTEIFCTSVYIVQFFCVQS